MRHFACLRKRPSRRQARLLRVLARLLMRLGLGLLVMVFNVAAIAAETSVCYGTASDGRLEGGVALPQQGVNFVSYSMIGRLAGRTYVHNKVRDIVVAAYAGLEKEKPGVVYKYAETGFSDGGPFKPHKTHQNGSSVDFMVPVVDQNGTSVHLPTHIFNKFGYAIEFDSVGSYGEYNIDYPAMAAHIVQLHREAASRDLHLWRVIFDPKLQKHLFETEYAEYLRANIKFSEKPSWVRHDEHYHVDFSIPCASER
jgi:penicillin-insensitive murein endopeptidase